jgi:hypothetical protein
MGENGKMLSNFNVLVIEPKPFFFLFVEQSEWSSWVNHIDNNWQWMMTKNYSHEMW